MVFLNTRNSFQLLAVAPVFCDLGFLDETGKEFVITTYENPNNFGGRLAAGQVLRVHLNASADNFASESTLVLEISWDGKWSPNANEMQKHLVIRELNPKS
jgi:hypothetical protein